MQRVCFNKLPSRLDCGESLLESCNRVNRRFCTPFHTIVIDSVVIIKAEHITASTLDVSAPIPN